MKDQEKYRLCLYIAGITTENQEGILNLKRLLKESLDDRYSLEVVDVFTDPEAAEDARIVATPTFLKALPGPAQKVILDFNSEQKMQLGIKLILETDEPR